MTKMMKVWIELPEPVEAGYTGEEICKRENEMLVRLSSTNGEFSYSNERLVGKWIKGHYIFTAEFGKTSLKDNGRWFNLDYFGRNNIEIIGEIS